MSQNCRDPNNSHSRHYTGGRAAPARGDATAAAADAAAAAAANAAAAAAAAANAAAAYANAVAGGASPSAAAGAAAFAAFATVYTTAVAGGEPAANPKAFAQDTGPARDLKARIPPYFVARASIPGWRTRLGNSSAIHRAYVQDARDDGYDLEGHRGRRWTLFHMTDEDAARSIARSQTFRPGTSGMFGAGIYFAQSESDCKGKAHKVGAVLRAKVALGRSLVCKSAQTRLDARTLAGYGCHSVKGTAPAVSRDEYAVFDPEQVIHTHTLLTHTRARTHAHTSTHAHPPHSTPGDGYRGRQRRRAEALRRRAGAGDELAGLGRVSRRQHRSGA